jgi:hypothetical protein
MRDSAMNEEQSEQFLKKMHGLIRKGILLKGQGMVFHSFNSWLN